jgi:dihydroorotate dehydrogenase electron transfer subunit
MKGYRRVRVDERTVEAKETISLYFEDELCSEALPGQFIMVWLPGIDEFPMSLSRIGRLSSITALRRGRGTEALMWAEELSIRGPFGSSFSSCEGRKSLVAGGIGMAPLFPMVASGDKVFLGAQSREYLPFVEEIKGRGAELYISTIDGSSGFKGNVIELLISMHIKSEHIYACGPMEMLKALYDRGIEAEASIESYMKCAIGICDSCAINGFVVCREGPVVKSLKRIFESKSESKSKSKSEYR